MSVATKLLLNWENVAFATTPITRVVSMGFDLGGESQSFSGDNDRYASVIAHTVSRPSCSITSGDVDTLMTLAGSGSIAALQLDALGVSAGNIGWALANAVFITAQESGNWGNFATATAHFNAYSSDGQTNPLVLTPGAIS